MASVVQSSKNGLGLAAAVSTSLNGVAAGSTLVAVFMAYGGGTGAVASVANAGPSVTWGPDADAAHPYQPIHTVVYRASNVPAGNYTVTGTWSGSATPSIALLELSDVVTASPVDQI